METSKLSKEEKRIIRENALIFTAVMQSLTIVVLICFLFYILSIKSIVTNSREKVECHPTSIKESTDDEYLKANMPR